MPISVGAVAKSDHLKVWHQDFGKDGDLTVRFDTSRLTPKVESELRAAFADPEQADPMLLAELMAAVVVDWDLLDDDGNQVPVTVDAIGDLSYGVLMLVWGGLREVATVGEPNGGT